MDKTYSTGITPSWLNYSLGDIPESFWKMNSYTNFLKKCLRAIIWEIPSKTHVNIPKEFLRRFPARTINKLLKEYFDKSLKKFQLEFLEEFQKELRVRKKIVRGYFCRKSWKTRVNEFFKIFYKNILKGFLQELFAEFLIDILGK